MRVSFSTDSNQSQQEQVKASSAIQEKKSTQFSKSQFTHPIPCRPRLRATPPKTSGNMFEARNRHESSGNNSKLHMTLNILSRTTSKKHSTTYHPLRERILEKSGIREASRVANEKIGRCLFLRTVMLEGRSLQRRFIEWID
jgi:hypothetical protein